MVERGNSVTQEVVRFHPSTPEITKLPKHQGPAHRLRSNFVVDLEIADLAVCG